MAIQNAYSRISELKKSIEQHHDPRIVHLASEQPDAEIMAGLLHEIIPPGIDYDLRFIAPGRSGAKVIMVVLRGETLPLLVKFADTDLIKKEEKNYLDFVKSRFPPANRVELSSGLTSAAAFSAIAYTWAGGRNEVSTFRDFFTKSSAQDIEPVIRSLLGDLIPWHSAQKSVSLPFDQWRWDQDKHWRINDLIKSSALAPPNKIRLTDAVSIPQRWRDSLRTKQSSQGVCHGDLNARNILVAKSGSGHIPILIDFASICTGESPARDWAKLEREIKFRCVWDAKPDPISFAQCVEAVDNGIGTTQIVDQQDSTLLKALTLIQLIRKRYIDSHGTASDIPYIEYLFFLFQLTLAHLIGQDTEVQEPKVREAILRSALHTLDALEEVIAGGVSPDWKIDAGDQGRRIAELRNSIDSLRETVLDLSGQLFDLQNQISVAKSLFEREFSSILQRIKEIEFRTERLRYRIDFKRRNPQATIGQVDEAVSALELEQEAAMSAFMDEIECSKVRGKREYLFVLSEEEFREAKILWRKLVRKVHPDMLDSPDENPLLSRTLQELYDMKETGYDPAKLAEIDARLQEFELRTGADIPDILEGVGGAETLHRLEKKAVALRLRKKQLRQEIDEAEANTYIQHKEFITNPRLREHYAAKLEKDYKEKFDCYERLNEQFTALFDAV